MKFGSQLREALNVDWNQYYLDYDGLKKQLKRGEKKEGGYTEKDESEFTEKLDKEIEKVYAFQNEKYEEIKNRVQKCEDTVSSMSDASTADTDVLKKYAEIEQEINEITEELTELSKYARLNYTGMIKIVKKHDRRVRRYILRPLLNVRLKDRPFYKETFESTIIQLSKLYHIVHQALGDHSDSHLSKPNFSALEAVSPSLKQHSTIMSSTESNLHRTYNYWVHPDNIMEVKAFILRHLPVLIYKPGTDSSITSIYFDSESFELYQNKVDRKPGDQNIRLRWYGNQSKDIFIERKIRKQGEDEVKDRISIKKKHVGEFLKGNYSMDKAIKKIESDPSKTEEDVERFKKLIKDIQDTIKEKDLEPVLRTYYNRMAFQIPGDQHVRISLDTDFYMIREDNFDNVNRREDNEWQRKDIINGDRLNKLPSSECNKFPFAMLEVKLNLNEGQQEPGWVQELVNGDLVEEAPQFSKYVNGVATLFTSHAPSLPYWLPNIDKDILKPHNNSRHQEEDDDDFPESSTSPTYSRRTASGKNIINVEVVGGGKDKGKAVDYSGIENRGNEVTPLLEEGGEEGDEQQKPIGLKTFRKMFNRRKRLAPEAVILPPNVNIPRKIITPIRVEPKVFFANERTFFSWMRFSIMLFTFSLALFNASGGDKVINTCGLMYQAISLAVLVYSIVKYNKRLTMINNRDPGPYDDIVAPPLVCFVLSFAIGLNFYLRYSPRMEDVNDGTNTYDINTYDIITHNCSSISDVFTNPVMFSMQNV